jgi:hypothetical protein
MIVITARSSMSVKPRLARLIFDFRFPIFDWALPRQGCADALALALALVNGGIGTRKT